VDALALLTADHETVRELFDQFKDAKEAKDTKRLEELQQKIFRELQVHTSIEEEVFYPEAQEVGEEADELVKEGVEEHHVVKILMDEIEDLMPDDDAFVAKMTVLIENVEHHAEEEEEELFPQLEKVFGKERLEAMGEKLQQAKERHGAPRVPESAGLKELTREELYEQAQKLDIPGRSDMSKEELAEAIGDAS
jgi:hemerythrin superfamily protein